MSGRTARKVSPDALGEMLPEMSAAISLHMPDGVGGHQHYHDPLQPLIGPTTNVTPKKEKAKKSKLTGVDAQAIEQKKERRDRYDRFIDEMAETRGNLVLSLSRVYGLPDQEIRDNLPAYRADVLAGVNTSSVSDMLEEAGIGKAARVALLKGHAYNPDEKVSLVALKMITDIDGDKHDRGASYESYLRVIMGRE